MFEPVVSPHLRHPWYHHIWPFHAQSRRHTVVMRASRTFPPLMDLQFLHVEYFHVCKGPRTCLLPHPRLALSTSMFSLPSSPGGGSSLRHTHKPHDT